MTGDGFEATFRLRLGRDEAWARLTGTPGWLPGFDAAVTVVNAEPPARLRATKDDEPCAGTDIVVTLDDEESGTRVHVVQSRFGDWFTGANREAMAIGWRFIVADLHAYLATGVNGRRHLRPWGDLGADATAADGGLLVRNVRPDGLAAWLGLADGDVLLTLAGAPVASLDDLVTVLRVLPAVEAPTAEWARQGALVTGPPIS